MANNYDCEIETVRLNLHVPTQNHLSFNKTVHNKIYVKDTIPKTN